MPWTPQCKCASRSPPAASGKKPCTQEDKRGVEEERVDPVEEAAMAGKEASAVLGSKRALKHRFGKVANRPQDGREGADQRRTPGRQLGDPDPRHRHRPHDAPQGPAERSLPGLAGRDALVELPPSERAPDELRKPIVVPDNARP